MEIWKDIKNYEDCYEVSSHGRVRRKEGYVNTGIKHNEKKLVKSKILKCNLKRNGYLTVDLSKNNQVKTISVHRIVALTFIENDDPINKKEVNHKNCNKLDNRVENLEWVTRKQNKDHALENNRYRCDHKKKIRCKQLNMTFESSYEAAEYLNIHYFQNSKQVKNISAKIRAATCGIQKLAYGFTWEYCI